MLDKVRLKQAFDLLGRDLARRQVFIEIAVYGACAVILQFDWRRTTEDVDAVVRPGYAVASLAPSVAAVARQMDLAPDWLNDAVGMFTPLHEPEELFALAGVYPADGEGGLRVLVARPRYLLAMKLQALSSFERGDKDMRDARALAAELGIEGPPALVELYRSVFGEAPRAEVLRQLSDVLVRP